MERRRIAAEGVQHNHIELLLHPRRLCARVADSFLNDRFSPQEPGLFRWIFDELINRGDRFFHLADLPQYVQETPQVRNVLMEGDHWDRLGKFEVG